MSQARGATGSAGAGPGGRSGTSPGGAGDGGSGWPGAVGEALSRAGSLGLFFAVDCGPRTDTAGFRPLAGLYGDPAALHGRIRQTARELGTAQQRVAASTLHLGTASRLWSVALGTAALTGRVPDLDPERLWWRRSPGGPLELWLPGPREVSGAPAAAQPAAPPATVRESLPELLHGPLHQTVTVRNLGPLAAAVRRTGGVSPQVLRGNSASALVGALRVLLAAAPETARTAVPLVRGLLDAPPLTGAGTLRTGPDGTLSFHRRSCCLYYRVPGAGVCGDCVLRDRGRGAGD